MVRPVHTSGGGNRPVQRQDALSKRTPLAERKMGWYARRKQKRLDRALFSAVKTGDIRGMHTLLMEGADVDARDEHGQTPLMLAAHLGYPSVVERLIRAGANVDAQDDMGGTALMSAVDKSHGTIAKMLLKAGAKANVRDSETSCTIELARRLGDPEMARLLRDSS